MKFKEAVKHAVDKFTSTDFIQRIKEEDATMLKHLDVLTQINQLGFITENSQAGRKYSGLTYDTKEPYETWERAYLTGFMLESMASEFIKELCLYTDKLAIFTPHCNDDVYTPARFDIPLTVNFINNKSEVFTHTSTVLPYGVWDMYRKEFKINKDEKIVFITCIDSKWNRNASGHAGLFTDILNTLKKIK